MDAGSSAGETPLHITVQRNQQDGVMRLLVKDPEANTKGIDTALHMAIAVSHMRKIAKSTVLCFP